MCDLSKSFVKVKSDPQNPRSDDMEKYITDGLYFDEAKFTFCSSIYGDPPALVFAEKVKENDTKAARNLLAASLDYGSASEYTFLFISL